MLKIIVNRLKNKLCTTIFVVIAALFLLDNGYELWLWQGWWPNIENDNEHVGSAVVRWQDERRAAMQTTVNYWKRKHGECKSVPAYLVWAGLEPLSFTNLFPAWNDRDDVTESNIQVSVNAYLRTRNDMARRSTQSSLYTFTIS